METVIFLHGYTETPEMWTAIHGQQRDAQEFHFEDVNTYFEQSDSIEAVAQQIYTKYHDAERIKVFGHSMGGYIACAMLAMAKKNLYGISLVNSTCHADDATKKEDRDKGIRHIDEHGTSRYLHQLIPRLFMEGTEPQDIEKQIMRAKSIPATVLQNQLRAMRDRDDTTQLLLDADIHKQFILGRKDPLISPDSILDDFQYCDEFFLNLDEHSGHMPYIEHPEFFVDALLEFLSA